MTSRAEAEAAALAVRRWAESAGVFSQGRAGGTAPQTDLAAAPSMFAAGAAETFAFKPITAVGFAASGRRDPRVFIYTRRKLTKAEEGFLRDNGLAVPVEFRVAQPFAVTSPSTAARFPAMFAGERLTCGSSISVGNAREAGTLGALLVDTAGELFGLSCNHVTGGCSNARLDLPIVAPAILDVGAGSPFPRTIGLHRRALPFVPGDPTSVPVYVDNSDAAVFSILDPERTSSRQGAAFDTPARAADPTEDAPVEKVGRTTRHTSGFVESRLVGPQRIDYNVTVYHSAEENIAFRGSLFFDPVYILRGLGGTFAMEGDSGALVIDTATPDDPAAVGLVIGGRGNEETYMIPLKPILQRLDMKLVSRHGLDRPA
jgi:hypothetical protein